MLAAGASVRMGRPKPLIVWRGRSFLRHVVGLAEAAGAAPIGVVAGAVALPSAELGPAFLVYNQTWPKGQTNSLVCGLQALTARAPGHAVLVLSVDRPHLAPATVARLAAAYAAAPGQIWQPAAHGRRGHPVIYPAELVPELIGLGENETPRDLLQRPAVAARRRTLAVDDPAVLDNLDVPADLGRLP